MGKKNNKNQLSKANEIHIDKISVFYRRSILKSILKMLIMEHGAFRSYKSVKNINRLFTNIDLEKYKSNKELLSFIWCICYFSKQWIDGIVSPDIIIEMAKRSPEFDNIKDSIINECKNDENVITLPEAKMLFSLITEALQFGFITAIKDEYIKLMDDIDLSEPGSFKQLTERMFLISQSLMDIKHNTNMVANKVTFTTSDMDSIKNALSATIDSLSSSNNIFKVGIRRWNTLLSPGYMNGRLYTYVGPPASGKSLILLKSALDIRKYNPDYKPKTPGMRPCVLYITMENSFTETIERIWNMSFDEPMTNYTLDEAVEIMCKELGISQFTKETSDENESEYREKELYKLMDPNDKNKNSNIELVVKYFSYREINTDDLYTIMSDLKDEGMEVCALVLDYLKRIAPSVPMLDNRKMELDRIMNELKALAVILDIPVITGHQMNRAGAAIIDNASRQGKGDGLKGVGREHTGDAWEVVETSDSVFMNNIVYMPGTNKKFIELAAVKRRRIDSTEAEFAKYTYLAHSFSEKNPMRLIDDMGLDKVLSLQSLVSDTDIVNKEKTNAVNRLQIMKPAEFDEYDD